MLVTDNLSFLALKYTQDFFSILLSYNADKLIVIKGIFEDIDIMLNSKILLIRILFSIK